MGDTCKVSRALNGASTKHLFACKTEYKKVIKSDLQKAAVFKSGKPGKSQWTVTAISCYLMLLSGYLVLTKSFGGRKEIPVFTVHFRVENQARKQSAAYARICQFKAGKGDFRHCQEEVQQINGDAFAAGGVAGLWQWHSNHIKCWEAPGLLEIL